MLDSQLVGMKVFVGSRDAAKGAKFAERIGNGCQGGGHAECLENANFILLCIAPGPTKPAKHAEQGAEHSRSRAQRGPSHHATPARAST